MLIDQYAHAALGQLALRPRKAEFSSGIESRRFPSQSEFERVPEAASPLTGGIAFCRKGTFAAAQAMRLSPDRSSIAVQRPAGGVVLREIAYERRAENFRAGNATFSRNPGSIELLEIMTKKTRFLTIGSLLAGLTLPAAQAQQIPSKKDTKKMIQQAAATTQLAAPGPPFHLFAKFKYSIDRDQREGTYELFWAAPNRFREEFRMGDVTETEVTSGSKLFVERSSKALPLPLWRIRQVFRAPIGMVVGDDPEVKRVYSDKSSGQWRICADVNYEYARNQICFDRATNLVAWGVGGIYGREAPSEFRAGEFQSIAGKAIPRKLSLRSLGETIEIQVSVLESQTSFAESVFVASPKAEARDWCAEAASKGKTKFPHPPLVWGVPPPPMAPRGDFSAYYILVGRDGQVANIIPLRYGPDDANRRLMGFLHDTKFPVRRCGDMPIDYEIIFTGSAFGPYGWY